MYDYIIYLTSNRILHVVMTSVHRTMALLDMMALLDSTTHYHSLCLFCLTLLTILYSTTPFHGSTFSFTLLHWLFFHVYLTLLHMTVPLFYSTWLYLTLLHFMIYLTLLRTLYHSSRVNSPYIGRASNYWTLPRKWYARAVIMRDKIQQKNSK